MNSKFTRMALPGLVIGLALGLSVPAAFAQDDHSNRHDRGDRASQGNDRGGRGDRGQSSDRGNRGGGDAGVQMRSDFGDHGQRGGFVGARTQTGAAVDPSANATGPGHPGWGDRGGGDRGGDRGGGDRGGDRGGNVSTDVRSGGGGNRGGG
ncbi:MAG: hypothetical protein ACXU8U_07750, partial [Asticcacaulis sp.]